jgi:glutamate synthase domain-containing protein 2
LKHIFSVADVPREYEIPLARYIHGLQGNNARQRLKAESEKRLKDEANSLNGEDSHQEDPKKDEVYRMRFLGELENQESNTEDVDEHDEYRRWVQRQTRAKILLWALQGSSLLTNTTVLEGPFASKTKEKKRKNRTTIIEYESSSSSSSSSESDDDSSSSDDASSGEESS